MKPFPIPVVAQGPGSQPEDETLDYMVMPQGMDTYRAPVLPEPEELRGLHGACQALRATLTELARAIDGLPTSPVCLDHLSEAERRLLNQVLGEGEVCVRVDGPSGPLLVQESVFAGVWRVIGPAGSPVPERGGSAMADRIEVGRMPWPVIEAASGGGAGGSPGARAQVRLLPDTGTWPEGVMNAPAVLDELEDHVRSWQPGQAARVINFTLLPLSPADLNAIALAVGQGQIQILSRGYGNCRITSTVVPYVWRVTYFNSQDAMILDTVEVTDMPEVACAAHEDLVDSRERLLDMLAWIEEA